LAAAQPAADLDKRLSDLEKAAKSAQSAGDNAWMLTSAALVLMMTGPGLALFYGGLVRTKNVLSTMMHSFVLMAVVSILWAIVGYSIAFGEGNSFFGGLQYLFLHGVGADPNADYAPTMVAATSSPLPAKQPTESAPSEAPKPEDAAKGEQESQAKMRAEFLGHSASTLKTIHTLVDSFLASADPRTRQQRLLDIYRKVHFVTSMAGMAGCGQIAQFVSAFEALLFEVQEKPEHITASTIQTITQSVDFLARLFEQATHSADQELPSATVLVVDDDVISNRLIVTALKRANMKASSEGNPIVALERLKRDKYDLLLLDISMPELDGFQLCAELRKLPAYEKTPVIFVTCHSDFESRSRGILSGGNDLIAKPILAIELAVKAVTHLLRTRLPNP